MYVINAPLKFPEWCCSPVLAQYAYRKRLIYYLLCSAHSTWTTQTVSGSPTHPPRLPQVPTTASGVPMSSAVGCRHSDNILVHKYLRSDIQDRFHDQFAAIFTVSDADPGLDQFWVCNKVLMIITQKYTNHTKKQCLQRQSDDRTTLRSKPPSLTLALLDSSALLHDSDLSTM